ncbi:MAG: hydantoinase/oxoprolinase family protein [Pseudomonadota bacterium]
MSGAWRIGVDSGGTFTDICLLDARTGRVMVWKVPSTPADPSQAIADGLTGGLEEFGGAAHDIAYLGHGTTVATNALIQSRIAKTGLITTQGFRDLLEIGRQKRPDLYDLQVDKPAPIAARRHRLEVPERLRHDGRIETPLDKAAVRAAAKTLLEAGVRSVAIAFLYAFLDPRHEQIARDIVAEVMPEAYISCSHAIAPEFREFERFSTTAVNAALGPVLSRYVRRLEDRVADLGIGVPAHITQSNGGVISTRLAAEQPVRTVLSGPATGVVGAVCLSAMTGIPDIITFDMGGTSSDVALVRGGRPEKAGEATVHGHPLKVPMLDIHAVGAGGGSIAHIDSGGLLKVGPQSAGADPGPACYGLGASAVTVTDANVALGVLHPTHLLGGRMPIDRSLAVAALVTLGAQLGLSMEATAQGVLAIVTANMAKAIRVISVQRGHDPRSFALMAFGGAGPIHAARLARELDCPRILVPPHPGVLCATGLLLTDLMTDFARTRLTALKTALPIIDETFAALGSQAEAWFAAEGVAAEARLIRRSVDMRYAGQNYELSVDLPDAPFAGTEGLKTAFEAEHKRMYGYIAEEEPIQLVTYRLEATGLVPKTDFAVHPPAPGPVEAAQTGSRAVWLPEARGWTDLPLYDRSALGPGHRLKGPAIVEQMDSTTLILPGQSAQVDAFLNILIAEAA